MTTITQEQQDAIHARYFRLLRDMACNEDHPGHGAMTAIMHRLGLTQDDVTAEDFERLFAGTVEALDAQAAG